MTFMLLATTMVAWEEVTIQLMLRTTESGMTTMIAQSELVVKEVLLALEPISSSIRGEID